MAKVLLVTEQEQRDALLEALNALGLDAIACPPKEAAAHARGAVAVAVAAFPDDAMASRFAAHLLSSLGPACPPIVSAVTAPASARDAVLIAGAADVAVEGGGDELARRVTGVLDAWRRASLKGRVDGPVRAQSGRSTFELRVSDVDVSGLGLASTDSLTAHQLVRVWLPLPSGELAAWGRVVLSDTAPGVRFLGMSAAERARVAQAVEALNAQPTPPTEPAAGQAPTEEPSPAQAEAPVGEDAAPAAAAEVEQPEALEQPEVPDEPAAEETPAEDDKALDSEAPDAAPEPTPARSDESLSASIGHALDEEVGAEGDVLASLLDSALEHRWPEQTWDTPACVEMLRPAATMGLVGEVDGAPDSAVALAFLRTLSPIERRVFDAVPPPELPPPAVSEKCIALRLRCFALVRDARERDREATRWAIDSGQITALKREVDGARAEIQKLVDGWMAAGETAHIRDANVFANSLNKAFDGVNVEIDRLRGDAHEGSARGLPLDIAEKASTTPGQVRARPPKPAQKVEAKPAQAVFKQRTSEQTRRRRLVVLGAVLLGVLVVRVVTWPDSVRTLTSADLVGLPGVMEIRIPPPGSKLERPQAAVVVVSGAWSLDEEAAVSKLKAALRAQGAKRFAVIDGTGALLATGQTGPKDPLLSGGER